MEHTRARTFVLTSEGIRLWRMAEAVIPELEAFIEAHEIVGNTLRLATITSVWASERQRIKDTFENRVPRGRILDEDVKHIDHTKDIVTAVRNGSVDLGIVTYPPTSKQLGKALGMRHWKEEEMVMVISAKNKEVTGKDWGTLTLFDKFPAVMLEKTYGIRREIDRYLGKKRETTRIAAELNDIASIKEMVAGSSDLITILPLPTVTDDLRLRWSRLENGLPPRPVSFLYRKDCRKIVTKFLDCFPERK